MVVLTHEEESKLLADYSRISWKLVHQFSGGCGSSIFSKEDLYQECMMVLVKHMNKCETKEQLRRIQSMDLINAMTRFVLKNQAVKLDSNRTDQIKKILEECARSVTLSKAEHLAYTGSDSIDYLIEEITLESFLAQKSVRSIEKMVVELTHDGLSVVEIAKESGKSHQVISYALKKARRKYEKYIA